MKAHHASYWSWKAGSSLCCLEVPAGCSRQIVHNVQTGEYNLCRLKSQYIPTHEHTGLFQLLKYHKHLRNLVRSYTIAWQQIHPSNNTIEWIILSSRGSCIKSHYTQEELMIVFASCAFFNCAATFLKIRTLLCYVIIITIEVHNSEEYQSFSWLLVLGRQLKCLCQH